ncbi:WD40 repeat domain-containing protein [Aliidiomarina sp. Khilg15.8]
MLQLVEMGEADGSWQPAWVQPHLLAIVDTHTVMLWNTREACFSGSWALQEISLRSVSAAQGRLLVGDEGGGLHLFAFNTEGTLDEHRQPDAHEERVSAVRLSQDGRHALSASRDGQVQLWSVADQAVKWRWTADPGQYATHLAFSPDNASLYIAAVPRGRLLGTPDGQSIVHLDAKNGNILAAFEFSAESHISSLLASDAGLIIGGSSNQWWLMREEVIQATRKYPRGSPFGQDAGTVIALYNSQDSLYAATTSGYLQIWLKQDIVNESTK